PIAMLRALWVDVRARQIEQGGSTLTQQLVRSYFLSSRQTLSRKVREAIMAMALDAHFTKADLMNAYINEIFLGQDGDRAIHGFGLASQFYFGKPLAELDLSEVALLVAVVRGPSYYDPRRHPERARARRDLVLKIMADQGIVTAREASAAAHQALGVSSRPAGAYYPAYLDFVRRTLRRDYHDQDLTEAGLRIYTSLEPRAQEQAEQALEHELTRLDRQRKHAQEPLEGAIVVTSPQSGDVIAIVGGRNVGYDGFDRALAESLNLATVGVGLDVGLPKVGEMLQRFGLPQPPAQVPAMLLGAVEVTPLEAAQLFNGLANGGFRNPLRAVRAVISSDGKP